MRIFIKTSISIAIFLCCNQYLRAQTSDFKTIDFTRADRIASVYKGARIDNLSLLAHQLTHSLPTTVEKFRAIYTWVCANISGDYVQHTKVLRTRKKLKNDPTALAQWNQEYKKNVFKKLLKHQKTMCTGYAYLIKELCHLANIEAVIVDGYGRNAASNVQSLDIPNHSWNAVKINQKWYLCDATWSSGYMTSNGTFIQAYNNGYFLADPALFGKNHFPLKQQWLLNEPITAAAFVSAPLVYEKAFEHAILPISPAYLETTILKNEAIPFRFKTTTPMADKTISLIYYHGTKEYRLPITNIQHQSGIVSFSCTFKHRGTYDTHLKINDDIVATYTIKVAKRKHSIVSQ